MLYKQLTLTRRVIVHYLHHTLIGERIRSVFSHTILKPSTRQMTVQNYVILLLLLFNFHTMYEFRFSDWLICTT